MSSTLKQAILSLKDRIADAYTAIANKGGTLPATQDSANLPTAIASIPSGGDEPELKDVAFIDYDGTIIQSYTWAEFESVTEFPTPPTHEGLTFVNWTNTMDELKKSSPLYTGTGKHQNKITIAGTMYKPTDNKVHIFIETYRPNMTFSFTAVNLNNITIDWGDGITEIVTSNPVSHLYLTSGKYEITYLPTVLNNQRNIKILDTGSKPLVTSIWFSGSPDNLSTGTIGQEGLMDCPNLKTIVAPAQMTLSYSANDSLTNCISLKCISSDNIGGQHRSYTNTGIRYLTDWTDVGVQNSANSCPNLRRINFVENPTSTSDWTNAVNGNRSLEFIWLNPNAGLRTMAGCNNAREIHIPHSSVPTLGNVNYFSGIPKTCKIYVKTGLLSQYETATNWSTIYLQYQFIEED